MVGLALLLVFLADRSLFARSQAPILPFTAGFDVFVPLVFVLAAVFCGVFAGLFACLPFFKASLALVEPRRRSLDLVVAGFLAQFASFDRRVFAPFVSGFLAVGFDGALTPLLFSAGGDAL